MNKENLPATKIGEAWCPSKSFADSLNSCEFKKTARFMKYKAIESVAERAEAKREERRI